MEITSTVSFHAPGKTHLIAGNVTAQRRGCKRRYGVRDVREVFTPIRNLRFFPVRLMALVAAPALGSLRGA